MRLSTLVALAALAAGCTTPPPAPLPSPASDAGAGDAGVSSGWRIVLDDLPAPLLSVFRAGDGVLFAVGGNGSRPLALRQEKGGWWDVDPGTREVLWWVHGFSSSDVYAVGEAGTVTHFNGQFFQVERTGGDFVLWGVWGAGPDDVWAVGGNPTLNKAHPVVLRRQRGEWREVDTGITFAGNLFKVWGSGPDDVVMVGDEGRILRYDGKAFRLEARGGDRLVTVFGGARDDVYAVGGLKGPLAMHYDGTRWGDYAPLAFQRNLNGGARSATGLVIVGWSGYLAEAGGPAGAALTELPPLSKDCLHGAAVLPDGFVAVGGDLLSGQKRGIVVARGTLAGGAVGAWPFPGRPLPDAGSPVDGGTGDAGAGDAGAADAAGAGVDAGAADAGAADTGVADVGSPDVGSGDAGSAAGADAAAFPPGAFCDSNVNGCVSTEDCWLIVSAGRPICTRVCRDATGCSLYGANACCEIPGPQTHISVCIPQRLGVCPGPDAGP